jgi:hypothetical protein
MPCSQDKDRDQRRRLGFGTTSHVPSYHFSYSNPSVGTSPTAGVVPLECRRPRLGWVELNVRLLFIGSLSSHQANQENEELQRHNPSSSFSTKWMTGFKRANETQKANHWQDLSNNPTQSSSAVAAAVTASHSYKIVSSKRKY